MSCDNQLIQSYVNWLFFFKQKTAYEMRISDWSSDVCSSDLDSGLGAPGLALGHAAEMANPSLRLHKAARRLGSRKRIISMPYRVDIPEGIEALDHILNHLGTNKMVESRKRMFRIIYDAPETSLRSDEHTSELQSLMSLSYAVFCLNKKHHI